MRPQELLTDIHALERELLDFEHKYGVRSEVFYAAYAAGEEPEDESWVLDFGEWASVYRTWLARQAAYRDEIQRVRRNSPSLAWVGADGGMSKPLRTIEDYELFLYSLPERSASIRRSTLIDLVLI